MKFHPGDCVCVVLLFAVLPFLAMVGCNEERPDILKDVARNSRTIYRASDSAALVSFLSLEKKEGKEKAREIAEKVKEELEQNVIPLITDPNVKITITVEKLAMAKLEFLDKNYEHVLKNAFDVLNDFYKSPTLDEALDDEGVAYLQSFFNGLNKGCNVYLEDK